MVDLSGPLALAKSLAAGAIRTAGTRVRFETRTTTTDPDTLEPTTPATVLGEYPAIVAPAGDVNAAPQLLPGVEVRPWDWRVVLLPNTPVPAVGVWVVVTRSRDPHLAGMEARVIGHTVNSAGAVLLVYARPEALT
jgi:hypothetical protein